MVSAEHEVAITHIHAPLTKSVREGEELLVTSIPFHFCIE